MSTSNTYTLAIHDLKPGMMLCGIVQQTGRLEVKNKGKVSHQSVIEQLIAAGVHSVLIETNDPITASRAKPPVKSIKPLVKKPVVVSSTPLSPPKPAAQPKPANPPKPKTSPPAVARENTQNSEDITDFSEMIDLSGDTDGIFESPMPAPAPTNFSEEAEVAEQLIISCKKLYKKTELKIERDVALDLSSAQSLVDDVQQSLIRNPNSLLCLSMIRNEGEYVSNHSMHVSILLCHFARYLQMSEKDCQRMALLGYFFDIGMLKVPKEILYKQGRPTQEEQNTIQAHVQHSLSLLAPLELDNAIMLAIEQHHERLDGSGYPKGLKGEDIHIYSRMLAIVDCYEAMTTNRPFQKKCSPASALKIISNKDYGYDQKLALKFIRCIGVYPVGSLVILSNQRIAIVIKNNDDNALKPVVMAFYSITHNKYIEQNEIDLSATSNTLTIEEPTLPEHYRLDLSRLSF